MDGQSAGEVGRGVGADRPERDIPEVEQAGEADDDVEAHCEQHVDRNLGCENRLDARVHVQRPLDRHQECCDGDSGLPVGELGLLGDADEFVPAVLGRWPHEGTNEVHRHPDQGEHEDDHTGGDDREPCCVVVDQDVDGGQPVCERIGS